MSLVLDEFYQNLKVRVFFFFFNCVIFDALPFLFSECGCVLSSGTGY